MIILKNEKTFLNGVLFLTVSAAFAKICGVLFKIPLFSVIGDEGMGYFNSAYVIYTFFCVFTTSGLPVGLSILVSDSAFVREKRAWRRRAMIAFGTPGFVIGLSMMLFPGAYARLIGNPGSEYSVFVMGPALFFVCLEGVFRGYFQGRKNMLPTAVSQVVESVFKVGMGLALSFLAAARGCSADVLAAYALTGITAGSFFGFLYLLMTSAAENLKEPSEAPDAAVVRVRTGRLMAVVLPVSLSSVVVSVSSLVDLTVVMHRLAASGFDPVSANRIYGNYSGLAIPFFNLPSVLIAPIASVLIPHIREARASGKACEVSILGEATVRLSVLLSAPCAVILGIFSREILGVFFAPSSALEAAPLLSLLAPGIVFVSVTSVCAAFLQASGHRKFPVFSLLAGACLKAGVCWFLIGSRGIVGAPIGTLASGVLTAALNLIYIEKNRLIVFSFKKSLAAPFAALILCAAAAIASKHLLGGAPELLRAALSALSGMTAYLVFVVRSGCIDDRIVRLFPVLKGASDKKKKERNLRP